MFESVQCQSCYSCCHSGESGRDLKVGAPSTVSRSADKTSGQRVAVKSSSYHPLLASANNTELASLVY